jgi:hypothetical protein
VNVGLARPVCVLLGVPHDVLLSMAAYQVDLDGQERLLLGSWDCQLMVDDGSTRRRVLDGPVLALASVPPSNAQPCSILVALTPSSLVLLRVRPLRRLRPSVPIPSLMHGCSTLNSRFSRNCAL